MENVTTIRLIRGENGGWAVKLDDTYEKLQPFLAFSSDADMLAWLTAFLREK